MIIIQDEKESVEAEKNPEILFKKKVKVVKEVMIKRF